MRVFNVIKFWVPFPIAPNPSSTIPDYGKSTGAHHAPGFELWYPHDYKDFDLMCDALRARGYTFDITQHVK